MDELPSDIEGRDCFSTMWFRFKNRQELNGDDRVPITYVGVLAQGGLTRVKPNQERRSDREMMFR